MVKRRITAKSTPPAARAPSVPKAKAAPNIMETDSRQKRTAKEDATGDNPKKAHIAAVEEIFDLPKTVVKKAAAPRVAKPKALPKPKPKAAPTQAEVYTTPPTPPPAPPPEGGKTKKITVKAPGTVKRKPKLKPTPPPIEAEANITPVTPTPGGTVEKGKPVRKRNKPLAGPMRVSVNKAIT